MILLGFNFFAANSPRVRLLTLHRSSRRAVRSPRLRAWVELVYFFSFQSVIRINKFVRTGSNGNFLLNIFICPFQPVSAAIRGF